MGHTDRYRSIEPDDRATVTSPSGALVHQAALAQTSRLERRLYEVVPGRAWTLVGNGLSNQSFVLGPAGVICIDTGESIEEMVAALVELRQVCSAPLAAVLLTHFHYVGGTLAAFDDAGRSLPVYGHSGIDENLKRAGGLIAPTYLRGLIEQFAIFLPEEGPDSVENVGLGRRYRDPVHAPHRPGYVAPTSTFDGPCRLDVAGLVVEVDPAPSDADDSVTYWFPSLDLAVHNLIWPVLFNVFAIRGEEYRDPRVLTAGIDRLLALGPEHLMGTHGPPISGAGEVQRRGSASRDAVQLIWDQTVRLANQGYTAKGIAERVVLPPAFGDDHLTQELYGLVEHHVRQVRSGLFGFFDGDPAELLPLPEVEHRQRLIAGFGGRTEVMAQMQAALAAEDVRWAIELGSWLTGTPESTDDERHLMAEALRRVSRRTPAANIRSWCLTRALELEGTLDLSSLRQGRLGAVEVAMAPLEVTVNKVRVMVDPSVLGDVHARIRFRCGDEVASVHVRRGVVVPIASTDLAEVGKEFEGTRTGRSFDGGDAVTPEVELVCSKEQLGALITGGLPLSEVVAGENCAIHGDPELLETLLVALDSVP
jgi:alkyl sulfatase BDS1-like metallo-beta-lactamase superfamily hydrolase